MAVDMFIQIEGIKGDSTDSKHKDWIEVLSYDHAITQTTGGAHSAQGAHAGGRADFSDFNFTKRLDAATPVLAKYCADGKSIPKITLELCRATGDKTVFMRYVFEDSIVSSFRPAGHAQGADAIPLEAISIRFDAVKYEYIPTDAKGKASAAIKSGWSTVKNAAV